TPILSIKEPENSLSMGYEHHSITPETESDEVTKSNAKNLLPIPSEYEVTLEDKRESLLSDPEIVSVEEENVVQQEEEEVDIEDISQIQDVVLHEKLLSITQETRSSNTTHANYSLPEYDSFRVKIKPDQERLINLVENDIPDNSSNDPLLEEVGLFLSNNSIPPGLSPEVEVIFYRIYVRFPRPSSCKMRV
nr:hypothetical protein [Tanacetum cinerariifolium]